MKKTYVYNTGNYSDPKDKLEIEVGVFFDGTLNNLKNTELRQKYKDRENKMESTDTDEEILRKEKAIEASTKAQEKEYKKLKNKDNPDVGNEYEQYLKAIHKSYMDKMGVDNSFSNDFTNVARKYMFADMELYSIYIEGIGTVGDDKKNRKDDGASFKYEKTKTDNFLDYNNSQVSFYVWQIKIMQNEVEKYYH